MRLPPDELLNRKETARQVQTLLIPETTVFVDTGASWFNGIRMKLPRGASFEIEMQWGHIGWSIPAALGNAMGKLERKVITVVGDGSFHMTAEEVSQMVRYKVQL